MNCKDILESISNDIDSYSNILEQNNIKISNIMPPSLNIKRLEEIVLCGNGLMENPRYTDGFNEYKARLNQLLDDIKKYGINKSNKLIYTCFSSIDMLAYAMKGNHQYIIKRISDEYNSIAYTDEFKHIVDMYCDNNYYLVMSFEFDLKDQLDLGKGNYISEQQYMLLLSSTITYLLAKELSKIDIEKLYKDAIKIFENDKKLYDRLNKPIHNTIDLCKVIGAKTLLFAMSTSFENRTMWPWNGTVLELMNKNLGYFDFNSKTYYKYNMIEPEKDYMTENFDWLSIEQAVSLQVLKIAVGKRLRQKLITGC